MQAVIACLPFGINCNFAIIDRFGYTLNKIDWSYLDFHRRRMQLFFFIMEAKNVLAFYSLLHMVITYYRLKIN